MAKIIELHPSVREHVKPRMSAVALAEYVILRPDQQERLLHDSRFSTPPVVTPYTEALKAIRSYNANPLRPQSLLDSVTEALKVRSTDLVNTPPKAREECLRCIEAIQLFQKNENMFGLRSLRLGEAPRFPNLTIAGVSVSIQPDLLVRPADTDTARRVGVVFVRAQKAPDPEACRLQDTRTQRGEHRREIARYVLTLAEMLLLQHPSAGEFDRSKSFVADLRLSERIDFSTKDNAARIRAIKAACKQIAQLWSGIEPRPSVLKK